jgi:dynein heavy chain
MTKPTSITTVETFARLWLHECARVFSDRLTTDHDRELFRRTALELIKLKFKVSIIPKDQNPLDLFTGHNQVIFGVLLRLDSEDPTLYEEIADKKKLFKVLEDKLVDYNLSLSSSKMDLVFFDDAIAHLCRIARILR